MEDRGVGEEAGASAPGSQTPCPAVLAQMLAEETSGSGSNDESSSATDEVSTAPINQPANQSQPRHSAFPQLSMCMGLTHS
jgi:hypothetical protein